MIRFSWPVLLAGALLALSCQKEPARELPEPEKPVVMDGSHKGPAAVFIGDSTYHLCAACFERANSCRHLCSFFHVLV